MTNLSTGTSGSATDVVVSRAAGTGQATWAMGMLFEHLVGAGETAGLLGASVVTQPPSCACPMRACRMRTSHAGSNSPPATGSASSGRRSPSPRRRPAQGRPAPDSMNHLIGPVTRGVWRPSANGPP